MESKKEVIPGGWVELLDFMGSDLDIVNAARISYNKKHEAMEKGDDRLIHFLLRNRHGSPFEMPIFKFQIRAPITVIRELQRHRLSSMNEISGRYVKLEMGAYVPHPSAVRTQVGKAGNYSYEPMEELGEWVADHMQQCYNVAYECYEMLLENGVARELARNVLPLGTFSEFVWQINARALMNFISLRSADNAMYEIRQYSEAIEKMFADILPTTYEAFIEYGRQAP